MNALHSKATPEWYTPEPFVEAARAVMGGIDLDPASCALANQTVKATKFYTKDDDGLCGEWEGRVFLNPPGGLVRDFWQKLLSESTLWPECGQRVPEFVWVGYSLQQLQTLQTNQIGPVAVCGAICYPRKRIAFQDATGTPSKSPTHANFIGYYGPNVDRFHAEFNRFGEVR